MGQNQSAEISEVLDEVSAPTDTPQKESQGIKLYRYVAPESGVGDWQLVSSNAVPKFFDANEDSGRGKKRDWILEIEAGEIEARADNSLNYVFSVKERRMSFYANEFVWALRFPSVATFKAFADELTDYIFYNENGFENSEKMRVQKLGDEARFYYNSDVNQYDVDMKPADQVSGEGDAANGADEIEDFYSPESKTESKAKELSDGDPIHGIIIGGGQSDYLMRGTHFDVLRNVEGEGVQDAGVSFQLTPARGSAPLTPGRVMLSHGERRMNLLTPTNTKVLHHADVEVGKVVSTYTFQKDSVDIPILDIAPDYKSAQLEERNTFLGLDSNRLCRWDLRDPAGVVQESPVACYTGGKEFSRGTNFSCMATSGDGFVVVGSRDGKVRLYNNSSLARANTSFPSLGAPITAVDVTYDGQWVLATTDNYLMVLRTTYKDDKGEQRNGFSSRMGGRGSAPRLLRMKTEDGMRAGAGARFTKGKFTWITEAGQKERYIVANYGRFTVVWSLASVRQTGGSVLGVGGLPTNMDYSITSKEEEVVDAAFLHGKYSRGGEAEGSGEAMVVATPHKLFSMF